MGARLLRPLCSLALLKPASFPELGTGNQRFLAVSASGAQVFAVVRVDYTGFAIRRLHNWRHSHDYHRFVQPVLQDGLR